jgi:hypothetical protein
VEEMLEDIVYVGYRLGRESRVTGLAENARLHHGPAEAARLLELLDPVIDACALFVEDVDLAPSLLHMQVGRQGIEP